MAQGHTDTLSRVVAITGTSSGLGAALATHLARQGHDVHACARRQTIQIPGVTSYRVDIRSETQVKRWADEIGRRAPHIDVLVNNAAVLGERARFATIPSDVWKNTLRTNILGTILVTRSLLSLLQGSDAGLIVNVGSIVGRHGRAGFSTYAVSKFAIDGLTQSLAQELASERIRVVSLLPSRVATELRRQAYETDPLESQRNVDDYLAAVDALIATAGTCLTGVALSSADISFWRL